jgi:hypothetical protein
VLCTDSFAAGDFGLARLLLGNVYILNRSGSGTIEYQAPEVRAACSVQCLEKPQRACVSVCLSCWLVRCG